MRDAGRPTDQRLRLLVWFSLLTAVVVLFGVSLRVGYDFMLHLVVGQWTWQHGAVPRVDDFTYTSAGQPFIASSWLAEVIFHGAVGG